MLTHSWMRPHDDDDDDDEMLKFRVDRRITGTKSQHVHTYENVASTCFRDMLQRHVPSCELILF